MYKIHFVIIMCYYFTIYRIQGKGRGTGFFALDLQNQKWFLITNYHVYSPTDDDHNSVKITFQHCDKVLTGDQLFSSNGMFCYDVIQRNEVLVVMLCYCCNE